MPLVLPMYAYHSSTVHFNDKYKYCVYIAKNRIKGIYNKISIIIDKYNVNFKLFVVLLAKSSPGAEISDRVCSEFRGNNNAFSRLEGQSLLSATDFKVSWL